MPDAPAPSLAIDAPFGAVEALRLEIAALTERLDDEVRARQAILDGVFEGAILVASNGIIELFNASAQRMLGFRPEEIVSRHIATILPESLARDLPSTIRRFERRCERTTPRRQHEALLRHKDGSMVPADVAVRATQLGPRLVYAWTIRDLRRRRAIEDRLAHAHRLESIAQLAAGIAHEINTPIQYIGNNLAFLRQAFDQLLLLTFGAPCPADGAAARRARDIATAVTDSAETSALETSFYREEVPRALDETLEGVQQVAKIVRAMKEFSKSNSDVKQPTDLNQAIRNVVEISRSRWKDVAEVVMDLDEDLPMVECVAGEMNEALLHLVVNAADAVVQSVAGGSPRGTIGIRTRTEGDRVSIEVSDTGPGISENNRGRIFDPFFTTKAPGMGTGHGLAVVQATIERRHGGTIDLRTEVGRGTTFSLRLPIRAEKTLQ